MSHLEEVTHDKHDELYGPTIQRVTGDDPNVVLTGFIEPAPPAAPAVEDQAPKSSSKTTKE